MIYKIKKFFKKDNIPKETIIKLKHINNNFHKFYKLQNKIYENENYNISTLREYNSAFYIKIYNSYICFDIDYNRDFVIYLFENGYYLDRINLIDSNLNYIENEIINNTEFIKLVDKIYDMFCCFYKDYSYILDSKHNYKYFEESSIKNREIMHNDILNFLNK